MKPLRVTYRAVFRSLTGPLNPLGVNIPVAMTVEVYEARPQVWKSREKDTGKDRALDTIPAGSNAVEAKANVRKCFKEQNQDWQMWGNSYSDVTPPRILYPREVFVKEDGKVYLIEQENEAEGSTAVRDKPKGQRTKTGS